VIYLLGSFTLGTLGAIGIALALLGHVRFAAWFLIATQPFGTVYDILTHQYGFLILSAAGIIVPIRVLVRKSHEAEDEGPG
jgi:hypothetical protein